MIGGGPQIEITYTAIEEAILQLLDPASIHGIPGDVESEEPINEPETSAPTNIPGFSSSGTYEVETCSSSNTRQPIAATTEHRSRSSTPSATAVRSTVTGDYTDEMGSSPMPSTSRSGRRPRTSSARKDEDLREMLRVQTQMRDSFLQLVANTECIASAMLCIAKVMQSKNPIQ
ncbi:hypothetical protein Hamer_G007131 [Homarus americanus]|uniref:Uncharacterized protein n=1 Tax=Homarus americanus TaxID=6706 RepID=A0A8J5JZB2_HOMAM|nr:hypothetical protein Hamer_G007131 [Homarus americanus]